MQEKWIKIDKFDIPKGEFVVTKFTQDYRGTTIELDDEKNIIEIFFDGIPVLLRNTVENARMRTWGEVQLMYHNKFFFRNIFLYEVQNSKLVQWLVEESCNFYEKNVLTHYCITTIEEVIDIIATFEPTVKVIKKI